MFRIVLTVATCLPIFAIAQDAPTDIPPDEWRDLAMGRTLVYTIGDDVFAYERYPNSGNRVELQLANGECLTGTWTHNQNVYCFDWGDTAPACFRHVRDGDDILIIEQRDGADSANVQQMVGTTDAPLLCGQQMS